MPGQPPDGRRLTFAREQRLLRSSEFERTRLQGQRVVKGCLILNWRVTAEAQHSRLGVVTSRKVGNAVTRSRARRLLREVFRQYQHRLSQPVEMVLVARHSIARKNYTGVERDFLAAARHANLMRETE